MVRVDDAYSECCSETVEHPPGSGRELRTDCPYGYSGRKQWYFLYRDCHITAIIGEAETLYCYTCTEGYWRDRGPLSV